jgi:hypothetical protein
MNDFYVGYLPKAPDRVRQFLRGVVVGLCLLALMVGLVLVFGQQPFAASNFEFGNDREFEGVVSAKPYPELLVLRPGASGQESGFSRYLLVAPGKHGADDLVAGFDGQRVRLKGQLIYRDGATMVEVGLGTIVAAGGSGSAEPDKSLGTVTVTGEIVDSKCYLGVMNPGNGKVHRDCASRCISGGIPPLFISNDGAQYLLVGTDGRALGRDALREFIAERISVSGELIERGERKLLKIDPQSLRHS